MDQTKISFDIRHPGMGLCVIVRIDGQTVWQSTEAFTGPVQFTVADDKDDHVLEIELSGKTWAHTQVDDTGAIIMDHTIDISGMSFDSINVDKIMWDQCQYQHDVNGTGSSMVDRFYGTMGCNGIVKLRFITPVYLWLLQNM